MKLKRLVALLLAAAVVFIAVPTGASVDPWNCLIVGEGFRYVLWKGYEEADDVQLSGGALPEGLELVKEYNSTENVYDFVIVGTPTKAGAYTAEFEICPSEAMHSFAEITFTVREKLKITVSKLPDATVGEYYSQKIPATYAEAEFTEWWNPGEGAILDSLGLELKSDGTLCGNPCREGEFHFYVTVESLVNLDSDEARIDIKILPKTLPTQPPTPAPTISPNFPSEGLSARFEAASFIYYVPGEEFEVMLISGIGGDVSVGNIGDGLPEGVKVIKDINNGEITVRGAVSPEYSENGGLFTVVVPMMNADGEYFDAYFLFRPAPEAEPEEYPAGTPFKVPFGS